MSWFMFAFLSALLSAAAAVLQKKILFRMSAVVFSLAVSVVGTILILPLLNGVPAVPSGAWALLAGKSVLGALGFVCVMAALRVNQISRALPLLGLTPAVTALLSLVAVGEGLRGWEWGGIGLMVVGTHLVESRQGRDSVRTAEEAFARRGRYLVLAALLLMAVTAVAEKTLLTGYRLAPVTVLFYQQLTYSVVFAVMLLARRENLRALIPSVRECLPLVVGIAVLTAGYRLAQLEATKDGPVALVLAVKRTSILYAAVIGGRIFSDERLPSRLAGAALIVAAGFIVLRYLA